MSISELCSTEVVTIRPTEDLAAAARLMRERHVGYLVVTEPLQAGGSKVAGVLTDRDIVVAVIAREVDPQTLKVADVMTRSPLVAAVNGSIAATLQLMRQIGVRRVPVVDTSGALAGVLSLDDVLDWLAEQLSNTVASIRTERKVEQTVRT